MKVYIDFDRTLFDCDRFLSDLYDILDKYNITKEIFRKCQNQCKIMGFNPYIILDLVKENINFDNRIYEEVKELIHNTRKYLYDDTISFLEYLKSLNYDIIILTKGNLDYQKEKIAMANLEEYYSELIVTMKHKGELKLNYGESIFIDDNPKEILSILKKNPKRIIRIQRNKSLYSNITIDQDVLSFKTLKEIIESKILN